MDRTTPKIHTNVVLWIRKKFKNKIVPGTLNPQMNEGQRYKEVGLIYAHHICIEMIR